LQDSLEQLRHPSDEFIKLARLNAAIFLFVANETKSINEGYELLND